MPSFFIGLTALLIGLLIGYFFRTLMGRWQADSIEKQAKENLAAADIEVARRMREAELQARAEVVQAKEAFEQSTKKRRDELQEFDDRLVLREENIDRKLKVVESREQAAIERRTELEKLSRELDKRKNTLDAKRDEAEQRLQRLAGMTPDEARNELRQKVEDGIRAETGGLIRRLNEEAKENAEREAKKLVANAIERYAAPHASELMTSTVFLPNEEIKGRIIGREGRNVRAIEAATGITLIVDGTPDAVVVSCFDPVRREIARQALEELIADGRIHPARIEEAVQKATENMESTMIQAGREAAYTSKQQNLDPEIIKQLGRLKFRTSYSQNVLEHSLEVSRIMGNLANEMGLDSALARRIGLLHDIGKSISQEVEGGHAKLGADMLRKVHEDPVLVNAVEAHHEDVEQTSIYAVLCSAADAISSARPGARSESTEVYIERLTKLEQIAKSQKGVNNVFAIQAGRELRVIVDPDVLNDNDAMILARDVSKTIEAELRYPGQIRVVVIREKRCMEYAR